MDRKSLINRRILLIVALVALAWAASGCGGEDDGESQSGGSTTTEEIATVRTSSLSKEEFLEKANALCVEARQRGQGELLAYLNSNELTLSRAEIVPRADEIFDQFIVPFYESEIDGIRALGAPKGDEERVAQILNTIQRGVDKAAQDPANFFFGNENPLDRATEVARAYGLNRCATT